jgi:hypothetical protein
MSGSLPRQLRDCVLSYVGTISDDVGGANSCVDTKVIGGGDLLGNFPSDFTFGCRVVDSPRELSVRTIRKRIEQDPSHAVHIMVASKGDAIFISSKLSEYSVSHRLLTSDVDMDQQQSIAKEWKNSEFSVLVSTSIAVVGNENAECRHLVVNGYLFNIITMVQAINRLRPSQRNGGASIQIYLPMYRQTHLDSLWDNDRLSFDALAERGMVPNDADLWKLFGSIDGLHQWLVVEDGCWISNLKAKFGTPCGQCNMCDRCKGTPVQKAAEARVCVIREQNHLLNTAMNVIRRLELECIVCHSDLCDGESCLQQGACFRCGGAHRRNLCTVDWSRVLRNKGCFYCLDIFSRQGFISHSSTNISGCPLQRRLKRLVIDQFAKSNEHQIDRFYGRISSERSKFYAFLAAAAPVPSSQSVTTLQAIQVSDVHLFAPLLPPDYYCNQCLCDKEIKRGDPVQHKDANESRSMYHFLKDEYNSKLRKREFVVGALYKNLIGGYTVIDCLGKLGRIELNVKIEGQCETTSTVTVVNVSDCQNLLESVVDLGKSLGERGNARKYVCDVGEMWGLGYKNKKKAEKYAKSNEPRVKNAMRSVCENVTRDLGQHFSTALDSITRAEQDGTQCPPLPEMGGRNGPGSCIMISKNLGNSAHIDYQDDSLSLAVWVEETVGCASNWWFILPNVRLNGKSGVAIRLFHGAAISWNGKLIRHCTSITETGENNNVYGCMFGSCRS